MERSTSSHKPASLTAAASESGLWTGADPRIVTLRRERDEALKEIELLKAELARRDKIWALMTGNPGSLLRSTRATSRPSQDG